MCGITGHFSKNKAINKNECLLMSDAIKHRGPESFGNYFEENIYLGHRRLSLIDLSETGHQPMWDAERNVVIVFNGEIYNYQEIKNELSEFIFNSNSDTEVIIYAYKKWGIEKAIQKFNGMFAFCIYDKEKRQAFFVRDRVGIKPFVYYADNENFIFASELKSLLKNATITKLINKKSVAEYFIYRYVPSPNTIFENINKLSAGYLLKLDLDTFTLEEKQYWKLNKDRYLHLSEKEIIKKADELIHKAIEYRLVADTEVGTFLSGGVDSSLISAIAKQKKKGIKAFSIDIQPQKYSEIEFAKNIAIEKRISLITQQVNEKEFRAKFDDIIKCYDEPFADSSFVPTFILTKLLADSGLKCALSGDGGDEVFFGYNWYANFSKLQQIKKVYELFPDKLGQKILSLMGNRSLNYIMLNSMQMYRKVQFDRFSVSEINELFGYNFTFTEELLLKKVMGKDELKLSDLSFIDFNTFLLDDILYKVDIASMANSIELRVPLLDHNLVEFMFSVSFKYLYKNRNLKYILKKISENYIPNKNIYRKKKGFSAPVMEWIDKDFKSELISGNLVKNNIIGQVKMQNFLKKETNQGKIWQMYIFEKWFSNYFLYE